MSVPAFNSFLSRRGLRLVTTLGLAVVCCLSSMSPLSAQSPDPQPPGDTAPPDAPAPEKPEKLDGDRLQRLLGDQEGKPAKDDPLDRAARNMRTVAGKMEQQETGEPTRTLQEQILKDLDALIQQAQQPPSSPPPPQSPPPSGTPQPQPPDPMSGSGETQPQEMPSESESAPPQPMPATEEPQPANAGNGDEKAEAEDSQEGSREAAQRRAELARREEMIKAVWGHLPPTVRAKLLNIQSDETLPAYRDLARRYYEALAEEGTQRGKSR